MAPVKKDFRPQNYGAVAQTLLAMWALHPLKGAALSRQHTTLKRAYYTNQLTTLWEPIKEPIPKNWPIWPRTEKEREKFGFPADFRRVFVLAGRARVTSGDNLVCQPPDRI